MTHNQEDDSSMVSYIGKKTKTVSTSVSTVKPQNKIDKPFWLYDESRYTCVTLENVFSLG